MIACVSNLRYYGGWADKIRGGAYIPVSDNTKISCHTRREPVGVVAAVGRATPVHHSSHSSASSSSSSSVHLILPLVSQCRLSQSEEGYRANTGGRHIKDWIGVLFRSSPGISR